MPDDGPLLAALADSQRLGMLGRLPVADVVAHSEAFVGALVGVTATVVDLGTGGGVPGLVIAWRRPDLSLVLADRRTTRTDHVSRLVHRLALADRVRVIAAEAATLPAGWPGTRDRRGRRPRVRAARARRPRRRPAARRRRAAGGQRTADRDSARWATTCLDVRRPAPHRPRRRPGRGAAAGSSQ